MASQLSSTSSTASSTTAASTLPADLEPDYELIEAEYLLKYPDDDEKALNLARLKYNNRFEAWEVKIHLSLSFSLSFTHAHTHHEHYLYLIVDLFIT